MKFLRFLAIVSIAFIVLSTPLLAQAVAPQQPVTVATGSLAGEALTWVMTTFGGLIGTVLTALLYKWLQKAGVDLTEAQRDKLQGIVVNGLNLGAAKASAELQGQGQIEIKNAAVASAVTYAQQHGADTLKALGLDPTSPAAVEAIKARIETAIADDNTPTHPALDPQVPALAGVSVVDVKPVPQPQ